VSESAALQVLPDLAAWAGQWDGLVERSGLPSPFLRSWWLSAAGGAGRRFLLVVRGGRLLGGLAVQEERRLGLTCVRMMGSGVLCPDHLDLLAVAGQEQAVVAAVAGWLGRPGQRIVDLAGLRADALVMSALPGPARTEELPPAPWAPLGMPAVQYLAGRPARLRKNVRKAEARLQAAGVVYRAYRGADAVAALPRLRELHDDQWGGGSRFLPGFERFAAACAHGASADEIAVHALTAGPATIAIMVSFEVAARVSLYQSARLTDFRWRDATQVLLSAIIADACDRGFSEVDFLRGDEPYKRGFASRQRAVLRVQAASGRLAKAALAIATMIRRGRRVARRAVRFARASGRRLLPALPRPARASPPP
jgi:CelD/BcsL family acetyltransferase involved in cellulose biosynthesis